VVEGAAQSLSGTWLAIRGRPRGLVMASLAIIIAFALAYVAHTAGTEVGTVRAVLKTAIVDSQQPPTPFGIGPVASFLMPVALMLAVAAAASGKNARPLATLVALIVASRARFDVPLCALMAQAAALCSMLAATDDRLRWRIITTDAAEKR
jgi:hypothetical protein